MIGAVDAADRLARTFTGEKHALPSLSIGHDPERRPPLRMLSTYSVAAGDTVAGAVEGAVVGTPVQLSSSNPSVTVPASVVTVPATVNVPGGLGQFTVQGMAYAHFTIRTARVKATTCAIITANIGGFQRRALLKVFKPFLMKPRDMLRTRSCTIELTPQDRVRTAGQEAV